MSETTNEEIRLAIYKAKGMTVRHIGPDRKGALRWEMFVGDRKPDFGAVHHYEDGWWIEIAAPQNYPESIAASYALEDEIDISERPSYANQIMIATAVDNEWTHWGLLHATARQRCEAWLEWHKRKESK